MKSKGPFWKCRYSIESFDQWFCCVIFCRENKLTYWKVFALLKVCDWNHMQITREIIPCHFIWFECQHGKVAFWITAAIDLNSGSSHTWINKWKRELLHTFIFEDDLNQLKFILTFVCAIFDDGLNNSCAITSNISDHFSGERTFLFPQ